MASRFFACLAGFAALVVALPGWAGPFAFVANKGSDDVSIVDLARVVEVARLPVVSDPKGVATNPTGTQLVVANDRYLSVYDLTDLGVPRVDIDLGIGDATDVVVAANGSRAWVSHKSWPELSEVSLSSLRPIARIPTGLANVRHMAMSPLTRHVYMVSELGSVSQMTTLGIPQARKIADEIAPVPTDLFVSDQGVVVLASESNAELLDFPEPAFGTNAPPATVQIFTSNPGGVAVHPAMSQYSGIILAQPGLDAVIDGMHGTINLPANSEPKWVRASPQGHLAIAVEHDPSGVSAAGDGSLFVLDPNLMRYAPLGDNPRDLEIHPAIGWRLHSTPAVLKLSSASFGARRGVIEIRSTGDSVFAIPNLTVTGADAGDFRVVADSCSGRSLDFADSCSVTVDFQPTPKPCIPNPWLKHTICSPSYAATLELGSDGAALHQIPLRGGIFVNGYRETIKASPIATQLQLQLGSGGSLR